MQNPSGYANPRIKIVQYEKLHWFVNVRMLVERFRVPRGTKRKYVRRAKAVWKKRRVMMVGAGFKLLYICGCHLIPGNPYQTFTMTWLNLLLRNVRSLTNSDLCPFKMSGSRWGPGGCREWRVTSVGGTFQWHLVFAFSQADMYLSPLCLYFGSLNPLIGRLRCFWTLEF